MPAYNVDVQLLNHIAYGGKIDFLGPHVLFEVTADVLAQAGDFQLLLCAQFTQFYAVGFRNQNHPGQAGISMEPDVAGAMNQQGEGVGQQL